MVAWMRLKYPHLVDGAWASSAPLHAEVDFYRYKEIMTKSIIKVGGERCGRIIENAFNLMEIEVKEHRTSRLNTALNLCQPLDLEVDSAHLFYELSDIIAGLIQAHRLGDIERACQFMKNAAVVDGNNDLDGFAAWIRHNKKTCVDMSYRNAVKKFSNVEWGSEANRQMRQWIYQTCSEFAWFQTSTSPRQIFGSSKSYPVEYFVQLCKDLYDQSWVHFEFHHFQEVSSNKLQKHYFHVIASADSISPPSSATSVERTSCTVHSIDIWQMFISQTVNSIPGMLME